MTKVRAIQQEQTTNGGHARNGIGHLQRFQGKNIFWCEEAPRRNNEHHPKSH